jgi:hypothetical protein
MDRLSALVEGYRQLGREDRTTLQRLEDDLDRAVVVGAREVPPDVVTLDSQVLLVDPPASGSRLNPVGSYTS